jgi:Flp pilus assembly protein TadD
MFLGPDTLLWTLALAAAAVVVPPMRPPRLQVPSQEKPIQIEALDVKVVIHGLMAETTQKVVFHNPNSRVLEGDLEFPLPDGATVSGFALDIGGQMVDGVVVGKDKARVVLETEIRKGIDPGLVEQVRGNLYRARVYPIPARGNRTVQLRWVSELTTRGSDAAYHLPLPYDRPVGQVAMRVEVVKGAVTPEVEGGFGNLSLRKWEDRWVAEANWKDAAPVRDLLVRLPKLPAQLVDLEPGVQGETFFSVSDTVPSRATEAPAPKRIALGWDASGSRNAHATERELRFIEALLKTWADTAVDVVIFRDKPEAPVAFAAGQTKKIIETLRKIPNDGGTDMAALDLRRAKLPHRDDALWVLVSDGLQTLGENLPARGDVPVWTITASSVADRALLRQVSAIGGGQFVDLVALDDAGATAALTKPGVRLVQASVSPADAAADLQVSQRADRTRTAITGRLLAAEAELKLDFGSETRVIKLRRKEAVQAGAGAGPLATAWAQARLEMLGVFADRNADEMLAVGRRFGLVSAGTSLLVLETLEQHLQHQVEPAVSRKEMRQDYLAQISQRDKARELDRKEHIDQVAAMWAERVRWWETDFKVPPGWRYQEEAPKKAAMAEMSRRSMAMDSMPMPAAPAPAMVAASAPPEMAEEAAPSAAPKKAKEKHDSANASIAIKPWDPQVPYLEPLRKARKGEAYQAYLAQKDHFASPAFYLDCAEFLLRAGEKQLGLRVLTNLAEMKLDDPPLLRVLAWRLSQAGELDLATSILEKVLRLRPEEPHSRRDLAMVLGDRAEAQNRAADDQRAVGLLYEVVQQNWDRFPEIELIALMELNRLIARAERRGWGDKIGAERVDKRLRKLLDLDLRVSLSWDADLTDVDLHLFEPTDEHAYFGHNRTTIGGLVSRDITQGYGPEEYILRRSVPGNYAVKVHYYGSRQQGLVGPATMIANVFTNYGRPDEKRQILTLRLDSPRDMEEVGVVTIAGRTGSSPQVAANSHVRTLAAFRTLRRGMSRDDLHAAVGQPDSKGAPLTYRLDDGSEVHVHVGRAGVDSVKHVGAGAELELLP